MDFAKKILHKYGWKEGNGLGKSQNGITKPLKAHLKFDKSGFGVDHAASDFNNHWWQRVYNEASSNIQIDECKDGHVKLHLKDHAEDLEISTKSYSIKKLKKAKKKSINCKTQSNDYENFLRTSSLAKGGGQEIDDNEKITYEDFEMPSIKIITDEELFAACGGRTAHKGARHGLNLNGKLSRIEKQEKELLSKMLTTKEDNTESNLLHHKNKKKKYKLSETRGFGGTLNDKAEKINKEESSQALNSPLNSKKIKTKKLSD